MLIDEARRNGARLGPACDVLSISVRTYQRWIKEGFHTADKRPLVQRKPPKNKLTPKEQEDIVRTCNSAKYVDLTPPQIVPKLADEGIYLASESSFYRILKANHQHAKRTPTHHRGSKPITTHIATAPNQVWSWDITWLPGPIRGIFFKLYLIIDIFSRFIVGWEVHENESAAHAETLIKKAVFQHGTFGTLLVLHSDNGTPMKAQNFQSLLGRLGITKSYSRPRVSNDNPYSESLFRTLKYRNDFPNTGFFTLEAARRWVYPFVQSYNNEFLHSRIQWVTPYQRHYGLDAAILAFRKQVYEEAKANRPERWSGATRDWSRIETVSLNPVGDTAGAIASAQKTFKL